jgi:hypothetical protein
MQLAKIVGDISVGEVREPPWAIETPETEARRKGGREGGKARAKKLSAKRKRDIARKASRARWRRD